MKKTVEEKDEAYKFYLEAFVKDREGPYAIQWPGKSWSTRYKKVSDPLIRSHLDKKYWVGVKSPWYPRFAYFDIDQPEVDIMDRLKEQLKLSKDEYITCTSPSFLQTGNVHLIIAPRYDGKPCTNKLLHNILKPYLSTLSVELYPQKRRKFRLPFGKDQYLIDEELGAPLPYSWREALYWVEKLDEFELKGRLRHQLNFPLPADRTKGWHKKEQAEELLLYGLQPGKKRHDSCFLLAQYFYRLNYNPVETSKKIKRWIRSKHNGFSKEVNRGNWNVVDKEIERQVNWVYENYDKAKLYPDSVHNLEGWITPNDLALIVSLFHGDVI